MFIIMMNHSIYIFGKHKMKKLLIDFFPIVLFFIAYKVFDIYVATGVLIVSTALQVTYELFINRKLPVMQLLTFFAVLFLGGATIYFHSPAFIVWKVSIVNGIFAIAFIGSTYFMQKPIAQRLMEENITLDTRTWKQVNNMWGYFFIFLAAINLIVYHYVSLDAWVDFKLFGLLGLSVVFIIIQGIYISKHAKE